MKNPMTFELVAADTEQHHPNEGSVARLEALRNAVRAGVADFGVGRFTTFESSNVLCAHLKAVAAAAIAGT